MGHPDYQALIKAQKTIDDVAIHCDSSIAQYENNMKLLSLQVR